MILREQPDDFILKMEVVGCFLENDGEFLILHRHDHKPQGGTWGLPGGKVEKGENLKNAIIREVEEETGFKVNLESINYFKELYVRYDNYDFIYHIFSSKIEERPEVILEEGGHQDYKWINPKNSLKMNNLIQDFDECIKDFYGIK